MYHFWRHADDGMKCSLWLEKQCLTLSKRDCLGRTGLCGGGRPERCGMFSSIPDLYP